MDFSPLLYQNNEVSEGQPCKIEFWVTLKFYIRKFCFVNNLKFTSSVYKILIGLQLKDGIITNKMFPKHKYSSNWVILGAKTSNNILYKGVMLKTKYYS